MLTLDLAVIRRIGDLIADTDDRDLEPGYLDTLEGETPVMEVADHLIGRHAGDGDRFGRRRWGDDDVDGAVLALSHVRRQSGGLP